MQGKNKRRYNQTKQRTAQEKGKQGQKQILYFKNNTEQDKIQIITKQRHNNNIIVVQSNKSNNKQEEGLK